MKSHSTSLLGHKTSLLTISLSLSILAALAVWYVLERSARTGTFSMLMLGFAFLAFGFIAGFAFSGLLMMSANSNPEREPENRSLAPVEVKTPKLILLSQHRESLNRGAYYDDSDWD